MGRLAVLALLVGTASASFCGDSAIPFSFEALPDGQPVLGCARPSCFGWAPNGLAASQNGNFYRINKRPDGFMRNDRASVPPFSANDARSERPMTSQCDTTFQSNSCNGERQWVGGIAPLLNVSAFPTVLQCCSYEQLALSTDRGVAAVNPGQIVVGGEVMRNGRQYAFDYIADVTKTINAGGSVSYDVSVRRMPCLPLPDSPAKKEEGKNAGGFRAYQAPTLQQQPIAVGQLAGAQQSQGTQLEGPFETEQNAVVEETVAEEGVRVDQPGAAGQQGQGTAGAANNQGASVQFFEARPVFGNEGAGQQFPGQFGPEVGQQVAPQLGTQGQVPFGQQFPAQIVQQVPAQIVQQVPAQIVQQVPAQIVQQVPAQVLQQVPAQVFQQVPVQPVAAQPAYAPAYSYPSYYYGGGASRYYCFTADTLVENTQGKLVRMDALEKGEWIKTISDESVSFAPVIFWLHRVPSQEAEFIKFTLEGGETLKITPQHYIYKTKCTGGPIRTSDISSDAVFAESVEVGECLYRVTKGNVVVESKVVERETITEMGIFAPMTSNGNLVVNGVYASCHSVAEYHEVQRTFFHYIDNFNDVLNMFFNRHNVKELPYGIETLIRVVDFLVPKQLLV